MLSIIVIANIQIIHLTEDYIGNNFKTNKVKIIVIVFQTNLTYK